MPAKKSAAVDHFSLAEACIIGAHARQAMTKGFSGPAFTEAELEALDRRFLKLLSGDLSQVKHILDSTVSPPDDSPVRIAEKLLAAEAPAASKADIKSLVSLCQFSVEMNRDGTVLQDCYKFLNTQGLAVAFQQIGLPMDETMVYRLADALNKQVGKCPYDVSIKMCALTFIKIRMWGERVSGIITAAVYARELERGPLVPFLPAVRAMPPMKICVLGHSFASYIHWSSHGTFPVIVEEVFKMHNPSVKFTMVNEGGMSMVRALEKYMGDVLSIKPDLTIIVLAYKTDDDYAALKKLLENLKGKAMTFDALGAEIHKRPFLRPDRTRLQAVMKNAGAILVPIADFLDRHPDLPGFMSLDDIHMLPPYHKAMAVELTRALVSWTKK